MRQKPASRLADFFSPDYAAARSRFVAAAEAAGMELSSYPIAAKGLSGETLTIDVARIGPKRPSTALVLSSALHGVEGYMGSAAQLAFLQRMQALKPVKGCAIVVIHALNPFGFAHTRRVNEDNIDLNRNFLFGEEQYRGSPEGYAELNSTINPDRAPGGPFNLFVAKAVAKVARHGFQSLKRTFSSGQYDYPKGISFGGHGPSQTYKILDEHMASWIGTPKRAIHLDFHSGLGKPGTYKLFVDWLERTEPFAALGEIFGAEFVESWGGELSYPIRGGMGAWCKHKFGDAYDVICVEFGTIAALRVAEALHYENRAHQFGDPTDASYIAAKERLLGAFCLESSQWRELVVARSLGLIDQSLAALDEENP